MADLTAPSQAVREEVLRCLRVFAWDAFGPLPGAAPPTPPTGPMPVPLIDLLRFAEAEGVTEAVATGLLLRLGAGGGAAALLLAGPRNLARAKARAYRAELVDLGRILTGAGIEAIALKGAATLADAETAPAWRDMIDLDLLIAPGALASAVAALQAEGWTADAEAFSAATDYHFPALFPPGDAPATLELHVRLGWEEGGPLAPEGLMARATPGAITGLLALSTADRVAHLVQHAQTADRRFARGTARLRDALDWRMLMARTDAPDPAATAALLAEGGARAGQGAESFIALQALIWATPAPADWARRHGRWVQTALTRLGDPAAQEAAKAADRLGFWRDALGSAAMLRHLTAGMLNPARRARFLARLGPGRAPRGD
jgi:hypothetical protein